MRNFSYAFPENQVIIIDFLADEATLGKQLVRAAELLLSLFETKSMTVMSPSEESVMESFLEWFSVFEKCGASININYPRFSNSADLPANTAFAYVNCNTGKGVVFTGYYRDDCFERTMGGDVWY